MGKSELRAREVHPLRGQTKGTTQVGIQVEESALRGTETTDALLDDPGFLDFAVAGTELAGEFRCADCGYGAVIHRVLPVCPMCGGTVWESRAQRFGR